MKKSTILMVVIVYVIAFFLVGLLGRQVRSYFRVDYLNEIKVSEFLLPSEEPKLKMRSFKQTALNEEQEVSEDRKRFQNYYEFETIVSYNENMVLKFNVDLVPDNTTQVDYKIWEAETTKYHVEKQPDGKIFVTDIKKSPSRALRIDFTLEDLLNHKIITEVKVYIW